MKINNLVLKNFRNYNNLKIVFNDNLNIIIGNNAQGKQIYWKQYIIYQ